ncbi:MAG: calcium/sodium antiporter [Thermodesulfobacteriota bacterium]|nr:calcium/sodium antiporter [Thermodesulfobacteriota bacterium]
MDAAANTSSLLPALLGFLAGFTMLAAGGEFLISGATRLAGRWGISSLTIGLTVLAFGTSMPELFVSLAASLRNHPDITIGNVVGSNIANIGLILAVSALISPLAVKYSRISSSLYLVIAVSLLVAAFAWLGTFFRLFGICLVSCLILYTWILYKKAALCGKKMGERDARPIQQDSYIRIFLFILSGLALLAFGSDFFINGAVVIARHFGISELIIGLTLAAVGTSLPELASCISAIRRNQALMLVGNIVGSNLFNLMMVLGTVAAVKPFSPSPEILVRDLPVMILFSATLIPFLSRGRGISRLNGFVLLSGYAAYLYFLM